MFSPISLFFRSIKQNHQYLDFVIKYILLRDPNEAIIDPFEFILPSIYNQKLYINRNGVQDQLKLSGNFLVIGTRGSGKTTLFHWLLESVKNENILIVGMPMAMIRGKVAEDPLPVRELIKRIFNAFWDDCLGQEKRDIKLPGLRKDRQWMSRLRWFYTNYPPIHTNLPEEFELMSWLQSSFVEPIYHSTMTEFNTLIELVEFITQHYSHSPKGDQIIPSPYTQIELIFDGLEYIPENKDTDTLIEELKLIGIWCQDITMKLFLDSRQRERYEESFKEQIQEGRFSSLTLPEWQKAELLWMLEERVNAFQEKPSDGDWTQNIPDSCLAEPARGQLLSIISDGAIKCYQKKHPIDAPVHLLKIVQIVLAGCAGALEAYGYNRPLSEPDIRKLVDIYWQEEMQ